MAESRHVAIGTPAYANRVSTPYVRSLINAMQALVSLGMQVTWLCHGNVAAVPRIRNRIVAEAIQHEVDDLVFIDSDIGYEPQTLVRLLTHDVPIVGGVMPTPTEEFGQKKFPFRPLGNVGHLVLENGLAKVAGLPTAFLRIRGDALREMATRAPTVWTKGVDHPVPLLFDYTLQPIGPGGSMVHAGEDFSFCIWAMEQGWYIHLDPYLRLWHLKDVLVGGAMVDEFTEADELPDQGA
jgi:hypothetical protein